MHYFVNTFKSCVKLKIKRTYFYLMSGIPEKRKKEYNDLVQSTNGI